MADNHYTPDELTQLGFTQDPQGHWHFPDGSVTPLGAAPTHETLKHWAATSALKLAPIAVGGLALGAAGGAGASASGAGAGGASAALPSTAAATTGSSLLPKLLNVGSQIAAPLASMEAGRAAGRTAEDAANQSYDRNNINRSVAADDNYQRNLKNALQGGLLQGITDPHIGPGTSSGGLRPSAILGKEDIGKQLQTQATKNLLASDQSGDTTTPALTPRPSSNGFDTALNVAAPILSLADLLKPKNYNTLPVPPTAQGTSKTTFGLPPGLQLLPPRSSY